MSLVIVCVCGHQLRVPEALVGQQVHCPACQAAVAAAPAPTLSTLLTSSSSPAPPDVGMTIPQAIPLSGADGRSDFGGLTVGLPQLGGAAGVAVPGYEVLGELGRGGMGVVYKARHLALKRLVALKMVLGGSHAGPAALTRFRAEAEAVARLRHANIVQVYEVGECGGHPFFALEFVEGGSLDRKVKGTPQPPREAAALVEQLARAMHAVHQQGVVHRDLKPANVLLAADGTPRITDFGLAKDLAGASGQTATGAVLGTPSYMAPEQAAGKVKEVGPLADVYALGAILYELLTGRPPFKGTTAMETLLQVTLDEPVPPSRLQPGVPADLETICLKCLEKAPLKRYDSAAALAAELRRYLDGEPIRARPITAWRRGVKWARRKPAVAGLLAGILLVSLLGVAGVLWKYFDAERQKAVAQEEKQRAEGLAEDFRRQKDVADEKTAAAEEAGRKAKAELDRAEGLVYAGNLLQAQLLWEAGKAAAARDRLELCRWDLRGWEHAHLRAQFDETCVTLREPNNPVRCLCFSPDSKRLAGGTIGDVRVKVWDTATGQTLLALKGPIGQVQSVCFSPDGRYLAGADSDHTVKVWDARTGEELRTLKDPTVQFASIAFSPDGKRLAGAGVGPVKLWDAQTGQAVHTLQGHFGTVWSVFFTPDGKRLVSAGSDYAVKVWDVATGKEIRTLKGGHTGCDRVALSPDGKRLAGAGPGGTVTVFDAATGQDLLTLDKGHVGGVWGLSFSPDGKFLATGGPDRLVKVWDASTGREVRTLRGHTDHVRSVVFSPDGKRLATAVEANMLGEVKLWDVPTGQDVLTFTGQRDRLFSVSFSPDGKRLAGGGGPLGLDRPNEVKVWDAATAQQLLTLKGPAGYSFVWGVSFSPDGRRLAGAGSDGKVKVWDAATGDPLLTLEGNAGFVWGVCFSPDGRRLASAHEHRTAKVWDAATGQELFALKGHGNHVKSVAFSPDSRRLATTSFDQTVRVWDAATGLELLAIKADDLGGHCVCFSRDGKRLATGGADRTVKVWDAATGKHLLTLMGHSSYVWAVAFSPDGRRIVTGSGENFQAGQAGELKVWDAATGQELLTLKGHLSDVRSVAFSPGGRRIASAGEDGTVRVWEAAAGQAPYILKAGTGAFVGVGFSPEGKRIISQAQNKAIRSWDCVTGYAIVPCTDPAPPEGQETALSPDGTLRATAVGDTVQVVRTDDNRPPSDLVFLKRLNDLDARKRWHRQEADADEKASRWFAAAFHLRQLLAFNEADADRLKARLKVCEAKLKQP